MNLDDLKERNYQSIIKEYLINENGYYNGTNINYDRYYAIDKKMLFDFLYDTQPTQMDKLKDI